MDAIEVVARLGDAVVAIVHLRDGRNGEVLRASSRGFGAVAACVQAVVEKIDFPIAPGQPQTTVRFSIGFR